VTKVVVASAPGKVVLSGEYAVLDGAPAICMAVDRRARVTLAAADGAVTQVRAPGFTDKTGRFESVNGNLRWLNGQAVFRIVGSVWRAANALPGGARSIELDTSEFNDKDRRRKIGIGSSAALTVALCAAVKGSTEAASIMAVAQRAHRDLQRGAGSGVDIACSLTGGLIEYRMEGASVTPLNWPDGLSYRLIWTGVPASTAGKLAKLNAGISKPSRVRLVSASEDMASAWHGGDADQIIKNYRDYSEQLRQFSVDHDLGIFDAGHDELWRAANAAHLTYKPCGAGGGDVGILMGTDEAAVNAFASALAAKFSVLECRLTLAGVTTEETETGTT
jgi:phosphomevalonate kinase